MGNLIQMSSKMDTSSSLESEKQQSVWTTESEQTLGLITTIKKEQQPMCPLHKTIIDCICLFEQCEEKERLTCHTCRKKAHFNHDQMSLQSFKDELLDYISFRRNERKQKPNSIDSMINQTAHILISSLIKQFKSSRVRTEQFILEGLANDIESLVRKIDELKRDQQKSLEARKQLLEFHQTFSQLIKSFIQRKNLTEAMSFWIQHDLTNDIQPFSLDSKKPTKTGPFTLKINTPKKSAKPYFSLPRFFENYSHKINFALEKKRISFCCQVVYLNQNYCLIPFAQGFQVENLAIYDMQQSKIVKQQSIDLYKHFISNNIVFRMEFNHFLENEFLEIRPNLEIFDRLEVIMNQYLLFQPFHLLHEENEEEGEDQIGWIRNQNHTIDEIDLGEDLPSPIIHNEQLREQTVLGRIDQYEARNRRRIEQDDDPYQNDFNISNYYVGWDNINNNVEQQMQMDLRRPAYQYLQEEDENSQINYESPFNEAPEVSNKQSLIPDQNIEETLDNLKEKQLNNLNQERFNLNTFDQEVIQYQELEENSKLKPPEEIVTEKECLKAQNYQNSPSKQLNQLRQFDDFCEKEEDDEDSQKKDFLEESKDILEKKLNQKLLKNKIKNEESNESSNEWLFQDTVIDQLTEINPAMQNEKEENSESDSQNKLEESNDNNQLQSEIQFDRRLSNRQSSLHNSNNMSQSLQPLFSTNIQLDRQLISNNLESESQNESQDLDEGFILSQRREQAESITNQPVIPNWLDQEGDNEIESNPFLFSTIGSNLVRRRPFLVRVNNRSVAEVENQTKIIIYKVNTTAQNANPLLKKEITIQTQFPVKSIFMVSDTVMCVCQKMSLLFSEESQISFINTKNGKTIKILKNIGFCGGLIGKLDLSEEGQMILYFSSNNIACIFDWKAQIEVKRFDMPTTISFENMRIFIQFFYCMYRTFNFNVEKVAIQLKDKVLQFTNFQENNLQYCLPYYSLPAKDKKSTIGICYLQDKNLKFVPFSLKKINISQGIAQMVISNDQLVIILKNGQIHHCSVSFSSHHATSFCK